MSNLVFAAALIFSLAACGTDIAGYAAFARV